MGLFICAQYAILSGLFKPETLRQNNIEKSELLSWSLGKTKGSHMACTSVALFAGAFLLGTCAYADRVTLNAGTHFDGIVAQKDENEVLLLRDYGTQWIPASMIKSITYDETSHPKTLRACFENTVFQL